MEIMLLNLDRSQDRLEYFHDVNKHLSNVTRVSAVDGSTLDRDALIRSGVIGVDLPYTAGGIGCALSHGKLWKQAVYENRPLTIAEDDVLFSYFFEERSRCLLQTIDPDWDFIMWGYGFQSFIWVDLIPSVSIVEIRLTEGQLRENSNRFQFTNSPCVLMRLMHAFGTVCYSVSPRGARKLLEGCFPLRQGHVPFRNGIVIDNVGIDCIANTVYPNMISYICVAPLAITENRINSTIK